MRTGRGWTFAGFLVGAMFGAATVAMGVLAFPFAHQDRATRLLAEDESPRETIVVRVLDDALFGTHGGHFPFPPFPEGIPELADRALAPAFGILVETRNEAGVLTGIASELEVISRESRLLTGRVMTETFWTIVLPGRGSLFLFETENNWALVKTIFLPMLLSGEDWSGKWRNVNTFGPTPDGRGIIVGGSGEFAGVRGTFLEVGTLRRVTSSGELTGTLELRLFPEA